MNRLVAGAILLLLNPLAALAKAPERIPIIVDTDIGSAVDDAFALALAVASPELELVAVTTCGEQAQDRAWLVCRFLTQAGVKKTAVAFGRSPQPKYGLDWQIQYRRHPAAIFNRTMKPVKRSATELMYQKLKERPGEITLVCIGPVTNVARLLKEHPDAKPWIKRIVIMGGSIAAGYDGRKRPEAEWNIKSDIAAAKTVFASGAALTVVPLDATATVRLERAARQRLFSAYTPLTFQVQNLYELWDNETPILFDPVAGAAVISNGDFLKFKNLRLHITDKGMTQVAGGEANARVAMSIRRDAFVNWYVNRLRSYGKPTLPKAPKNRTQAIKDDRFPARVHACETYDTDIEKRWWMCGKAETKDVFPGGVRACRAVLTQDFDARMGDTKTMYRAVIFNPVPGPPMGPNTRLRFRYKLKGTDTIRVQLYSLSKGYHRYLSIGDLPTGKWAMATVDMTAMRRPDGSGGPLSANERIDDIQFYVDPRGELLIDDIVLYEAGAGFEKRPFPKRILFTGWFDTGKQGREWPGDFAIVKHKKPRTWRAAKSVIRKSDGKPWIRLHLRGERLLGKTTELFFRYRVKNAGRVDIELYRSNTKQSLGRRSVRLEKNGWREAMVRFSIPIATECNFVLRGDEFGADEVRFLLPVEGELLVDDVLLYVPGR